MKILFFIAAFAYFSTSHAALAPVSTSGTFAAIGSGFAYKTAATDAFSAVSQTLRVAGSVNIGGKAITIPLAIKYASNAPKVAAAFAFSPAGAALIAAAALGSSIYDYYLEGGFELLGGVWMTRPPAGVEIKYASSASPTQWASSPSAAAAAGVAEMNKSEAPGWVWTVRDCTILFCNIRIVNPTNGDISDQSLGIISQEFPRLGEPRPATQTEFENGMDQRPFPDGVPQALPIPLPVEEPVINPSDTVPPVAQPINVPTGAAVPVPDSFPSAWTTPTTVVTPAPAPGKPLQVDLRSRDVTTTGERPSLVITTQTGNPAIDGTSAPPADTPGLCDLFPSILACAELGEAEDVDPLKTKDFEVKVFQQAFWQGGSCPDALHFTVLTNQYDISYAPLCDLMIYLRFIFVSMGAFIAAFILSDSFRV